MQHYNYMILSYWRRISCSLSGKRTSFSAAPSALSAPSVSVPRSCCQDFSWHFLLMAAKCLLLCKIAGVIRRWILGTLYFWVLPSFKGLGVLSCLVLGLLLRQRTALHFQQQLPKMAIAIMFLERGRWRLIPHSPSVAWRHPGALHCCDIPEICLLDLVVHIKFAI